MAVPRFLEQFGYLFYIVSPNKTTFRTLEEVPDYITQVIPHFTLLMILEQCILLYKKKPIIRLNDGICSISQGILQQVYRLFDKGIHLAAYTYIYNNWRLATLPWDSLWTWWLCFLATDFAYYWFHRASHEINIFWAAHQVHHSSEDFNLSTALRRSVVQTHVERLFHLPLALAIPPSVLLVHNQFNLLFQFCIHTQVIQSLGPLEYILNTASHHRVHHGRNRYCIDKNYAGVLIIWDRLFGTFQAEGEEVVYGLTNPLNSFNSFYVQLHHFIHIWRTFWVSQGVTNKLSVLFKGPGWSPGNPWCGNTEDIPDVKAPVEKFNPVIPKWCRKYAFVHFTLLIALYVEIAANKKVTPQYVLFGSAAYEVLAVWILGMVVEGRFYAPWAEMVRCFLFFSIDYFFLPYTRIYMLTDTCRSLFLGILRTTFLSSFLFWAIVCARSVSIKLYSTDKNKD